MLFRSSGAAHTGDLALGCAMGCNSGQIKCGEDGDCTIDCNGGNAESGACRSMVVTGGRENDPMKVFCAGMLSPCFGSSFTGPLTGSLVVDCQGTEASCGNRTLHNPGSASCSITSGSADALNHAKLFLGSAGGALDCIGSSACRSLVVGPDSGVFGVLDINCHRVQACAGNQFNYPVKYVHSLRKED